MKTLNLAVISVLAWLPIVGASATQRDVVQEHAVVLTERNNREAITLDKGKLLEIKLRFPTETAYTWKPIREPAILTRVKGAEFGPTVVGRGRGPRFMIFRYRATAEGRGLLRLSIRSATGRVVGNDFTLRITVR